MRLPAFNQTCVPSGISTFDLEPFFVDTIFFGTTDDAVNTFHNQILPIMVSPMAAIAVRRIAIRNLLPVATGWCSTVLSLLISFLNFSQRSAVSLASG